MILDDPELKKELALNGYEKNKSYDEDDERKSNRDDPSLLLKNMENDSRGNIFTPEEH